MIHLSTWQGKGRDEQKSATYLASEGVGHKVPTYLAGCGGGHLPVWLWQGWVRTEGHLPTRTGGGRHPFVYRQTENITLPRITYAFYLVSCSLS